MRKTRMISVIAASLLTATVVFTGCGGGGSSATTQTSSASSVSSSASSQSSTTTSGGAASSQCLPGQDCESTSSSAAAVKKVIVSDGYVLGATVKCKTGENEPVGVATANPGEYELNVAECAAKLCAKDGFIDVNDNNKIDSGEPKAPKMTAPGSYTNINPYTTLIANGMTPAEVAEAFGLDANTSFDTPVPESTDAAFVKNAVLLSAMLSYIEAKSSANTKGMLPLPGTDTGTIESSSSTQNTSSEESSSSTSATPSSIEELIQALRSGKSIEDLLPPELEELPGKLSNVTPDKADDVAAPFIAKFNGAYSENASSSAEASEGGILPVPGDTTQTTTGEPTSSVGEISGGEGQEESSSSEATSSSEESSSSEATSSSEESSSSSVDALPNMEEEESSSSEAASSSEEECEEIPGQPCSFSSSSEAASSSEENTNGGTEPLPEL